MKQTYLASNLKYLRDTLGLSQDEVAEKLFISRQTLSNYEIGKTEPSIDMIQKLASVYNVTFDDLIQIDFTKGHPKSKLVIFDSVIFDKKEKNMIILDGTQGTYDYRDIVKVSVLNEQAIYRGKTKPFLHQITHGTTVGSIFFDPSLYVGLRIEMKDGSILAIYTSKEKTSLNTKFYFQDREVAFQIEDFIDKVIARYSCQKMNTKKKVIRKLELDNKQWTEMHENQRQYSKGMILFFVMVGIFFVIRFLSSR